MRLKPVLSSLLATATLVAGAANAGPLITNGNFELTTNGNNKQLASTAVTSGTYSSLTGWTSSNGSDGGYNFVLDSNKITTSESKIPLAKYNSTTSHNNVFASDAVYHPGYLYQLVTGLSIGTSYSLTFDYAVGQQANYPGTNTDNYWKVVFGGNAQSGNDLAAAAAAGFKGWSSASTTPITIAQGDFSGWKSVTMNFTATSTEQFLGFLASGGTVGAPPFMLLDNVAMSSNVSEPASLGLILGGLGLVGFMARRRRDKKA